MTFTLMFAYYIAHHASEMKATRQQYKRKWMSASRSLRNNVHSNQSCNDCDNNTLPYENVDSTHNRHEDLAFEPCLPEPIPSSDDVGDLAFPSFDDDALQADISLADANVQHSSDSEIEHELMLEDGLVDWANKYQVKHNAIDGLLQLLKQCGHPDLPGTARSLLKTTREIHLEEKSGMQYLYYSFSDMLLKHYKAYPVHSQEIITCLQISLNIDGLPLFKSSRGTLWPILCGIMNMHPVTVFPVALTYGESKPKNLEFLHDAIRDLKLLLQNGLKDGNRSIQVFLKSVVCDAPAKAFVKNTKLYSGYFGCDKCNQSGVWHGRLTFPEVDDIQLRTDASFRSQSNEEHHKGMSPFCDLPIDMVKNFPIDYMHQLCLGVMKKLILLWMRGAREVRISVQHIEEISERIVQLKSCIPQCFVRKPRRLSEVDRWKATEYRQFLLYTGKIVLKGILRPDLFEHFMALSVASSILACPKLVKVHNGYAGRLLNYFVKQGCLLYGDTFPVYNVHSLVHFTADVVEHGCLDECSGFPFENYLQQLKRMVRSGRSPLAQIAKRLSEVSDEKRVIESGKKSEILTKPPENGRILENSLCCQVVEETRDEDEGGRALFLCRVYSRSEPLFSEPCDSRLIGVHKVNEKATHMQLIAENLLGKQAVVIGLGSNFSAFLAVLHQY